jgi:hypothetical protein
MRSVEGRLRPSADNRRLPRPSEESHQLISWVRTFNSQLPLRYGDYIAKVQLAPVSDDLTSLTGRTVDIGRPDILRELVVEHFRQTTSVWEFRVQLGADLETMPIGDPTK